MKEKPTYYAIIPASVRYSSLKPNAKLLYGEITALSNKLGFCYATNNYFAELYNVSKNTISSWLSDLNKAGFITIDIKRNSNKQIVKRCIGIKQKEDTPINEKMKGNSTSINNTSNNISIRRLKFINDVSLFDYDKSILDDFTDYWTEPTKSKKTMRFELCKTWDLNLRLKNWCRNEKKWSKPKGMSKLDSQINSWQEAKKLL
jgi:DNA-binding transcriptional ArsR family regulator